VGLSILATVVRLDPYMLARLSICLAPISQALELGAWLGIRQTALFRYCGTFADFRVRGCLDFRVQEVSAIAFP
jgi:hypothetical protein